MRTGWNITPLVRGAALKWNEGTGMRLGLSLSTLELLGYFALRTGLFERYLISNGFFFLSIFSFVNHLTVDVALVPPAFR